MLHARNDLLVPTMEDLHIVSRNAVRRISGRRFRHLEHGFGNRDIVVVAAFALFKV